MNNQDNQPAAQLPSYITSATPNPVEKRAPWYANTTPAYLGVFLWFVFWGESAKAPNAGGALSQGLGVALLGVVLAALVCHFLFYLVPGLLGMKTGLPLYIVGTSTFGARGGFLMPGFLMGVLQFGWLGVSSYFSGKLLAPVFATYLGVQVDPRVIMVVWAVLAAFVGLKGIQYVAKVATYLPLITLVILLILLSKTVGTVGNFDPQKFIDLHKSVSPQVPAALSVCGVLVFVMTYVVGFFATAGAAGADFGTNSRNKHDVQMGGLVGIALAIIVTIGISLLVIAGTYGSPDLSKAAVAAATEAAAKADPPAAPSLILVSTGLIPTIMGAKIAGVFMFLLALAAFPGSCFSSFIAANSFKATLPTVNPFISCGIGTLGTIALAVTGLAGKAITVFQIIGASFGPICGAMMVDYLLAGGNWPGPRAGFNLAGWLAWLAGFAVGIMPALNDIKPDWHIYPVPAAPVAAFVVGAVVYFVCAKLGLQSQVIPLPAKPAAPAAQ
jgi:cytosine permease